MFTENVIMKYYQTIKHFILPLGLIQISSLESSGNFEHSKLSGHIKSNVLIIVSHARADSQRDRHGGIGNSRIVQT